MFTGYDRRALREHPCVFKVDDWGLELDYYFRVELFKSWKVTKDPETIKRILEEHGLNEASIGDDYHLKLADRFEFYGFPDPSDHEVCMMKNHYEEQNPLILSGLFSRNKTTFEIVLNRDLMDQLTSNYPRKTIEESFRDAGLEPQDIGYQRLKKIEKAVQRSQCKSDLSSSVEAETIYAADIYTKDKDRPAGGFSAVFYNENYLLYPLGIKKILEICELEGIELTGDIEMKVLTEMKYWTPNGLTLEIDNEQTDRILKKRVGAMAALMTAQFQDMGRQFKMMDIDMKRMFCQWIGTLPKDPAGLYTKARILKAIGLSKTTYYRILNDPEYGSGEKRRIARNETDIDAIKAVISYKGFKKGIRQIYMLLPKVAGKKIGLNRIRTLMERYGIETGLKKPHNNRKAMKELVERNKKANLLMRRFKLHRPNEVRLTDVTYLNYGNEKRAYGSASIDPVTGKLVCFIVSGHNDLKLALDTLKAMDRYPAKAGAILHSDQGMLYMHDDFQSAVKALQMDQSMSRRGNCWDNAPQESFFGHFKQECAYQGCKNIEELRCMIEDYGVYYNEERGIWDREKMTPIEYEAYLNSMTEGGWRSYLQDEEERYRRMQEEAARNAIETARAEKSKREEQRNERTKKCEEEKNDISR